MVGYTVTFLVHTEGQYIRPEEIIAGLQMEQGSIMNFRVVGGGGPPYIKTYVSFEPETNFSVYQKVFVYPDFTIEVTFHGVAEGKDIERQKALVCNHVGVLMSVIV